MRAQLVQLRCGPAMRRPTGTTLAVTATVATKPRETHRHHAERRCDLMDPYRGRDAHYWAPPAQIRRSGLPAYGSYLGCLTAKRTLGQGCRVRGLGSHSSANWAIRSHVVRPLWLRRRSVRSHKTVTWYRKAASARLLVGTAWVVEEPSHDLLQPLSLFGDRPVHASPHFLLQFYKLRHHTVSPCLPVTWTPAGRTSARRRST